MSDRTTAIDSLPRLPAAATLLVLALVAPAACGQVTVLDAGQAPLDGAASPDAADAGRPDAPISSDRNLADGAAPDRLRSDRGVAADVRQDSIRPADRLRPGDSTPSSDLPRPADTLQPDAALPDAPLPDLARPDGPRRDKPARDRPRPDLPLPDRPRPDKLRPDRPRPDQPRPDLPPLDLPAPDLPWPDLPPPADLPRPPDHAQTDAAKPVGPFTVDHSYPGIATLSDSELAKMRQRRFFFGHQSVGYSVMVGVTMIQGARYQLTVDEDASAADFAHPLFGGFWVGSNLEPYGKLSDFVSRVRGPYGAVVDAAFFKFGNVDFGTAGNGIETSQQVIDLFDAYKAALVSLAHDFPGVVFVHLTVPLEPCGNPFNDLRNQYNQLLRAEYSGGAFVYDLADLEATRANGSRCTFSSGGQTYDCQCLDWALQEGGEYYGHLNDPGRLRTGEAMVYLLAKIAADP